MSQQMQEQAEMQEMIPREFSGKSISDVLGVEPVLPGEPEDGYREGLKDLIAELDAKSQLQIYLAEKIYDSLWWIRRYEDQKRTAIIAEMGIQVSGVREHMMDARQIAEQKYLREALLQNNLDKKSAAIIKTGGFSMESLRQAAMTKRRHELEMLDKQIALQAKVLAGFQASYEVAFNRKRNVERLDLQNALLRRDLQSIEGQVVNGEPKTKSR